MGESGEEGRIACIIWTRETLIGIMLTVLRSGGDGGESLRSLGSGVGWRKESGGMNGGLSKRSGICGECGL
jgi:hypothetical protein